MTRKLGRKKDHREHMKQNLLTSLVLYEKLETTKSKAKELSSSFDRLITVAKKNDLTAKKSINALLFDKKSAAKVFEILVPRYKNRDSGYTSMVIVSRRKGDNSAICRLELMDKKVMPVEKKDESKKTASKVFKEEK
jgi:large subunit ribosomal protein L17